MMNMIETNYEPVCSISAPGKVILCGQHAVVYGKDAIAIGISLHCKAQINRRNRINENTILIRSDIQSDILAIDSKALLVLQQRHYTKAKYTFQQFQKDLGTQAAIHNINSPFQKSIHFKLSLFLKEQQINWKKWHQQSLSSYLIDVSSQIPISKCLGSSAAFNTVLTTALLIIFEKIQNNSQPSSLEKQTINHISMQMESVEHGNPSGIDNYISVNGGVILYNKTKEPRFKQLRQSLATFQQFINIAIIDSGINKNTKTAVSKVRQKYDSSQIYKQKIEEIGQLAQQIKQIIQDKECNKQSISRLLTLTSKNHSLLRDLQVSHPKIQQIVDKWQKQQWSVKITGSGMGGCVLLLSHKQVNQIAEDLLLVQIDNKGIQIMFNTL